MSGADQQPSAIETLAARQGEMLRELAEIGMRLVRELPEKAQAEDADLKVIEQAYTHISRGIRLSLNMEAQLALDAEQAIAKARPRPADPVRPPEWQVLGISKADYDEDQRIARRRQVARALIETAVDKTEPRAERDRLACDLMERFDEGADEARFVSTAPLAEVITRICQDLGLDPAWRDFKPKAFWDLGEAGAKALVHGYYKRPTAPLSPGGRGAGGEGAHPPLHSVASDTLMASVRAPPHPGAGAPTLSHEGRG